MNSKNLYNDCFVVFLDILGVKNLVTEFEEKKDLMKNLIDTLKINKVFSEANQKITSDKGMLDIRSWYFSDSFVFLMKAKSQNLPHLFLIIRYLQDRFWENGYLLRGAITKEKMYYPKKNENILLGQGIINAYKLESEIAIYPRIVVDKEVIDFIDNNQTDAKPFGNNGKLRDFIKPDNDGIYFLDLLNNGITRKKNEIIVSQDNTFSIQWNSEENSNLTEVINSVKNIISTNKSNDIKIKQKYDWLKSYLENSKSGN